MTKKLIPVALLTLTGAILIQAQDPDQRRRRGPNLEAIQEALNLTPEQLTALRENNRALRGELREIMSASKETREALRTEMQQESPNPSIVGQHMVDLKQTAAEVKAKRAEYRASALAVLDEEQQAKLAEIEAALKMAPLAGQARGLNLLAGPERDGDGPQFHRRGPGRFGGFPGGATGPRP